MKRSIGFLAICVLLLGVSLKAQAPPAMPKPGPEVKRLAYFIGTWKEAGTAHMKDMGGPDGPVSSTSKSEWLSGGFFVVAHGEGTSSMGTEKTMGILGYDPNEKMYTYHEFDSTGGSFMAKGTVKGDTWSWTSESMEAGKTMKTKVTIKEVSKTEYTFKMEASSDGGKTWMTGMESTNTKVMPPAPPAKKK